MVTIILTLILVSALIAEIITDSFEIKKYKKLAHLMQLVAFLIYVFAGVYTEYVYFKEYPVLLLTHPFGWFFISRILLITAGYILLRLAMFNPLLNAIMGWPAGYKGKTDVFDVIRTKFETWLTEKTKSIKRTKLVDALFGIYALISLSLYPVFIFIAIILLHKGLS